MAYPYRWVAAQYLRVLEQVDNYPLFERQALACYWTLLKPEWLTMSWQVTVQSELPITNPMSCDPPHHTFRHTQQQFIIKSKWFICNWSPVGPEGTRKLYEKVVQMPMVPAPATRPSLFQSSPMASERVPYSLLTQREYLGSVCRWLYIKCRHYSKVDSYGTTAPFWDISEEHWWKTKLPVGRTKSSTPDCSLCLEKDTGTCAYILIHRL